MKAYTDLIDACNDAKMQHERDIAEARLDGARYALQYLTRGGWGFGGMQGWGGIADDQHSMARFGDNASMCCGVLLGWKPSAEGDA